MVVGFCRSTYFEPKKSNTVIDVGSVKDARPRPYFVPFSCNRTIPDTGRKWKTVFPVLFLRIARYRLEVNVSYAIYFSNRLQTRPSRSPSSQSPNLIIIYRSLAAPVVLFSTACETFVPVRGVRKKKPRVPRSPSTWPRSFIARRII